MLRDLLQTPLHTLYTPWGQNAQIAGVQLAVGTVTAVLCGAEGYGTASRRYREYGDVAPLVLNLAIRWSEWSASRAGRFNLEHPLGWAPSAVCTLRGTKISLSSNPVGYSLY